jgi:DNA-directed RNA polymerase specialized sigma subunit
MFLAPMIATAFSQHRPCDRAELEAEGYLAMCKAAQRYEFGSGRHPKGYFALAIVNRIFDCFKKSSSDPMSPDDLAAMMESYDEVDHLGMAIRELPSLLDQRIAHDRFACGATIPEVAATHRLSLYEARIRVRQLAKHLAALLGSHALPQDIEPESREA